MHFRFLLGLMASALVYTSTSHMAEAQQYQRSFRDWSVFKHDGNCYAGTAPIKQAGNYNSRGQPYVLVVKRGETAEINAASGYPYKQGSETTLRVDGNSTRLFTQGETAWAYTAKDDATLVKRMKAGSQMVVKGTSQKGTTSTDTYSLLGFTAAHGYVQSECR